MDIFSLNCHAIGPSSSPKTPKCRSEPFFGIILSNPLSNSSQTPTNYRINTNPYTNANVLNRAILVSRPIWQEQSRKLALEATQLIFGCVACSFSPQSMNSLQTTARTFTHGSNPTIHRIISWSRSPKHEIYRKNRFLRFPAIFWGCCDRVLDRHLEFRSNHHTKLHPWTK